MNQLIVNQNQIDTAFSRVSTQSGSASVLADIYQDEVNIAIWQRTLSLQLLEAVERVLALNYAFRFSASITPEDARSDLYAALGRNAQAQLISDDVSEIVGMFCYLFDLKKVGLRLTTLDRAMCPKFHVDRVPCRLVTTYSGAATEWLSHQRVDRAKLGLGSQGLADNVSGVYRNIHDVQQLVSGDVALLKGEAWSGNEGGGLVHRSPNIDDDRKRLLLTLDFN